MFTLIASSRFEKWFGNLRDRRASARIRQRLARLEQGHVGDAKSVGDGVSELRIDYGPGYRVYFMRSGSIIIVLLCGGHKGSQGRDIEDAKRIAREWKE
ncbi:type II toxin-antitoxin system RelE/ParE family toxin [Shinella granuli]|uniref:Putative addiction module killer protein n=1 Tax=Shinella granuli TaxID=323621 RepID=A0A4R2D257_SHIGR|nr:type II toxin-antitoxin system RelE/ParE family toxin [Shinella granuli]TCN47833.1 putative addiction module killer protein [Shinella granuli]